MDTANLLRAIRHARNLSQRELADLARLPRSTVDRIESGQTRNAAINTIERILEATGYRLAITTQHGYPLDLDTARFRHRDSAGRRFPAHLRAWQITSIDDRWWGWSRLAWQLDDPAVPEWTYGRRYPSLWDDP